MTLFEFFAAQIENAKQDRHYDRYNRMITEKYAEGSFEWFKAMSRQYFGGGYLWRYLKAGVSKEDVKQAHQDKVLKYSYDSSWEASKLGNQDWYGLTAKGLKEFYKYWKEHYERG